MLAIGLAAGPGAAPIAGAIPLAVVPTNSVTARLLLAASARFLINAPASDNAPRPAAAMDDRASHL
jgi:hypothetical protein